MSQVVAAFERHARPTLHGLARACTCVGLLVACAACPDNFVNDRATPVCAVRNCKTGEVIDDGCSADGKCLPCSNDCGGKVAPRNGPASSSMR